MGRARPGRDRRQRARVRRPGDKRCALCWEARVQVAFALDGCADCRRRYGLPPKVGRVPHDVALPPAEPGWSRPVGNPVSGVLRIGGADPNWYRVARSVVAVRGESPAERATRALQLARYLERVGFVVDHEITPRAYRLLVHLDQEQGSIP